MAKLRAIWASAFGALAAAAQNGSDSVTPTELSTVVVHLSLVRNATTTTSTTGSITTALIPTGGSLSSAANNSSNGTNTTLDPAASCNAALIAWSSDLEYETTINSTYSFPKPVVSTVFPPGNDTFKLCDGWPRAHGEPTTYTSTSTSTSFGPKKVTRSRDSTTPKPSCTIGTSACSSLWSSYSAEYGVDPDGPQPACPSTCDPLTTFWTDATHPPCTFQADPVRLVYFPVSVKGDRLCGTNYSTITSNDTVPRTIEALGTTFTSGTAYISFPNLQASDRCGVPVGTRMENFFLPLPSSDVSSRCGEFGGNQYGPTSVSLNFADLNTPIALSVYSCMAKCQFGVHDRWQPLCPTIYDDYAPALAYPTAHIQKLQPEWANCGFDAMLLRSDVLYDPPLALSEATSEAGVTLPPQTAHVSTALPPPTPTPTASPIPDDSTNDPEEDNVDDANGEDQDGSNEIESPTGNPSGTAADPSTSEPSGDQPAQEGDNASNNKDPQDSNDANANDGDPAGITQNITPTSAAAIGDAIASIIGLVKPTQAESDNNNVQPSDPSSEGSNGDLQYVSTDSGNDDDNDRPSNPMSGGDGSTGETGSSDSHSSQAGDPVDNLVAAVASAAAGNGELGSGEPTQQSVVTAAGGQVLPIETNSAGGVLLGGSTLPADGSAVTINGQVYSMHNSVVYQDSIAAAPVDPASGSQVTPSVPFSTNAAGYFIVDGTTLSNGDIPVTLDGQTLSMSSGILYQNGEAVATAAAGSENDPSLTIDGHAFVVSTNSQGAVVLDGKTISPGGSPVTIGGQTYSMSEHVLYQNGEAVATAATDSETGSYLTFGGHTFAVSTNSAGAIIVDGETISSGSPATIDGLLFSVLGNVLYHGSHPVTTMTPKTTSASHSVKTTGVSSSASEAEPTTSTTAASATPTGDAKRLFERDSLMLMSLMMVSVVMICL